MEIIYSVKDNESGTFIKPFTMATDRDAIEGFRVVSNDKESNYNKFPDDYLLVNLGEFNPRTGEITQDKVKPMVLAKDLISLEQLEK